ncbi:Peroxidase [Quillaja saponaria]|uniref:Peroxidase n=1 Tax=Quillaja saponaria TaxID=32244 RepID=A0AAD7Q8Q1_QUISA|nr:Peroxidase [Quillaja saponaria]
MAATNFSFLILLLPFLFPFNLGTSELELNFYSKSCPRAEHIIKQQVAHLYNTHGNLGVQWIRNLFHDCLVKSCDASILLDTAIKGSSGLSNYTYIDTIKAALEEECPLTVSCADILALSAREAVVMLGGQRTAMKTGRRDNKQSSPADVEPLIAPHNDTIPLVLSRFQPHGIGADIVVGLLGGHSISKVHHCINLADRLYPTVDPTLDPEYAKYLKTRCPNPNPKPTDVFHHSYARSEHETLMVLDNTYYKKVLKRKGLLTVDEQLGSDPRTLPYVKKMAADNKYFHQQFSKGILMLSEINPLTGDQGEIRKNCRFVNK